MEIFFRFYYDEGASGGTVPPSQEGLQRSRSSKRSLPKSLPYQEAESVSMKQPGHVAVLDIPNTGSNNV